MLLCVFLIVISIDFLELFKTNMFDNCEENILKK